jgi:hypothetical protein
MITNVHPLSLEILQGKIRCNLGLGKSLEDTLRGGIWNPGKLNRHQANDTSAGQSHHDLGDPPPSFPHIPHSLLSGYPTTWNIGMVE